MAMMPGCAIEGLTDALANHYSTSYLIGICASLLASTIDWLARQWRTKRSEDTTGR